MNNLNLNPISNKARLKNEKLYVPVKIKFLISFLMSVLWIIFSIYLSKKWLLDLIHVSNVFIAIFIIAGIAYIPGFINTFLVVSILLDKQPPFKYYDPKNKITILIAAYNEEKGIYNTLSKIKNQDYKGVINTIVINNNSSDNTVKEVYRSIKELNLKNAKCIDEPKPGKFNALNTGLNLATTKYIITLDADTLLHPKAIRYLVSRMNSAPSEISAIAGSVLVRNSRDNLLSKIQEWDYFLSIMSIKRMQGLFQGTLVAQGAFSIYKTKVVKELGGWSDAIGEDIVLTWKMLMQNKKVYFEPLAISFTNVPIKFSHFYRQRSRWARGMIEGLRLVKPWQQPNIYIIFLTSIDLLIPYMDLSYTIFFIPGCILALLGKYYIVGPFLIYVFPLTLFTFTVLYLKQKTFFNFLNLKVRKNKLGFWIFILFYQMIMSPISLIGYIQEFSKAKRVWK